MSQIITLDDLTSYMTGTTLDDTRAQQVVDGINSYVESRTARCFGETKQVTERYDYKQTVWLRRMDVISIDAVTLGWPGQATSTADSTAYYLNPFGRLTFFYNWGISTRSIRDYLLITYTYGTTDVPDDLKMAALGVAAGFYNWASNGQKDVASVAVGSYKIEYTGKKQSGSSEGSTSDANWSVIESYRLKRV